MGDDARVFEAPDHTPVTWWTISSSALLAALQRAADGDSPDIVYAELYANSEHEVVD